MRSSLKGKVTVITGASSGIGMASAREFAKTGATLVLAARSTDKLEKLADELKDLTSVLVVTTDVSKEEDCKHLIEATVEKFGRIDILINNAGLSMRAMFKDLDLAVIHRLMDVNFWGCVYCTKYALPYLLESKGSIVGVTSISGYKGLPARTGYSASKFAMNGFLDTLRTEHMFDGLHVMTFAPGFTASNVRFSALTADGSAQGATPRSEEKMMAAPVVARHLVKGIRHRRNTVILTFWGKVAVFCTKFIPRAVALTEYMMMRNEPYSPLTKK